MTPFTYRLAQMDDLPALRALMTRAIEQLQHGFLTPEQVAASHETMGLDTQLIRDQTYFVIERAGQIVGCGGWSWRATLFGGDDSVVPRDPQPLNPKTDAAKIRAMYVDPDHARQGIGRLIMDVCENAARSSGFGKVELMATLAGAMLYRVCGYEDIEPLHTVSRSGVAVPKMRMSKTF